MPLSYRNQSIDLLRKSMDRFLYDIGPVMKGLRNNQKMEIFFFWLMLMQEKIQRMSNVPTEFCALKFLVCFLKECSCQLWKQII